MPVIILYNSWWKYLCISVFPHGTLSVRQDTAPLDAKMLLLTLPYFVQTPLFSGFVFSPRCLHINLYINPVPAAHPTGPVSRPVHVPRYTPARTGPGGSAAALLCAAAPPAGRFEEAAFCACPGMSVTVAPPRPLAFGQSAPVFSRSNAPAAVGRGFPRAAR